MPDLIKKINQEHELTASYSPRELRLIDEDIINKAKGEFVKERILSNIGNMNGKGAITADDLSNIEEMKAKELEKQGSERKLTIPKEYITMEKITKKGFFNVTDEQTNGQRKLDALASQLQLLQPGDPQRQTLINEMMEVQGISSATFGVSGGATTGTVDTQGNQTQTQATIEQSLPQGQQ
ncbi:MAG: hypothetical protein U9R08_01000 [Nanoarchaeota archaeon]|nr:hypothetical protein [Nanoarchaeota archaeon]